MVNFFPHQDLVKSGEPITVFHNFENSERVTEDPAKVGLLEKPIVMSAVNEPITLPAVTRVMAESPGKTGKEKEPPWNKQRNDTFQIESRIALPHVMEAPAVNNDIEAPPFKGKPERIPHKETVAFRKLVCFWHGHGPRYRSRQVVHANGSEAQLGTTECMSPFSTPKIQNPGILGQVSLFHQALDRVYHEGSRLRHRPSVNSGLVRLLKIPLLLRVKRHRRQSTPSFCEGQGEM